MALPVRRSAPIRLVKTSPIRVKCPAPFARHHSRTNKSRGAFAHYYLEGDHNDLRGSLEPGAVYQKINTPLPPYTPPPYLHGGRVKTVLCTKFTLIYL